jgi:Flp pilus assembly protein TadG
MAGLKKIMGFLNRFQKDETGNLTVEMALVYTMLAVMMLGSVDFGRLMFEQIRMEQLARTGAQVALRGQTYAIDLEQITSAVTTAHSDAQNPVTVSAQNFCECPGAGGVGTTAPCDEECVDEVVPNLFMQVTVSRTYEFILGVPGFDSRVPLTATAVVRAR